MRTVLSQCMTWVLLAGLVACDSASTNDPTPLDDSDTRVSVFVTDAPGDVAAVWVDVVEIYFQGGPGGRTPLLTESTGLIELTSLADQVYEVAADVAVESGTYAQLRFVIASAVLETLDGSVYTFGDAEHPGGLERTGDLMCPSCSSSGLKVKLSDGQVAFEEGDNALVLDFDVSQSFERMAGNSSRWRMSPVVNGTKLSGDDPEDPNGASRIAGSVVLASAVSIPACPDGEERSLQDFVPLAAAVSLLDEDGNGIVRSGEVDDDGAFSIDYVDPDDYAMSFEAEIAFGDDHKLVFEATVEPAQVTVPDGEAVEGVIYTVVGATCEAVDQAG
jgi:hypothetical protein